MKTQGGVLFGFGVALVVLFGGCGEGILDPARGKVTSIQFINQGSTTVVGSALDQFAKDADPQILPYLDSLRKYSIYSWQAHRITYYTTDAVGQLIQASGLMVVPISPSFSNLSVPILSLQHPTQVERQYAPSQMNLRDPLLTVQLALVLASTGYIVLVPDYPGLGVDTGVHPYCHRSIAASVVDMIRAGRDCTKRNNFPIAWNKKLFLFGYSEGGYATLITARELQTRHADEFTVTAVAPLDGPYSLSESMRNLMLNAPSDYHDPYYLPYVLRGFDAAYAGQAKAFQFFSAVKTSIPGYVAPVGSTYARELYTLLDGNHTANEIDDFMRKAQPYLGPRSILTDAFIADLQNPDSEVCQKLAENDAYRDWVPQMPLKMFHHADDDLVSCDNADQALRAFQAAGASTVELEKFEDYLPEMGSIHAGAAPFAYVKAFIWMDTIAYPDRH
jgi:pimeloyl-ACP methyl ester carboxylesterase